MVVNFDNTFKAINDSYLSSKRFIPNYTKAKIDTARISYYLTDMKIFWHNGVFQYPSNVSNQICPICK